MITLATAENSAIHLHPLDNVAIARVPVSEGLSLKIAGRDIRVRSAIPAGHKVALRPIAAGENIVRYGQMIGRAKVAIEPGEHVHTHNVAFEELTFDYEFPSRRHTAAVTVARDAPTFLGYAARRRPRGNAQLYRGGRGQQLRGAHGRTDRGEFRGRIAAGKCRRRGRVPAWRRLRPRDRSGYGAVAANAGGRAGSSERFGGDHSGARLRGESDRSLPGCGRAAYGAPGRHDAAIERRNARDRRRGAPRDLAHDRAGRGEERALRCRLRRSCWG